MVNERVWHKTCAPWLSQRRRGQTLVEQKTKARCYIEKKGRERNRKSERVCDYTILWPLPPTLGSVPILLVSATCQALNYTALGFSLCESSIRKGGGVGRLDGGEEGNERGMEKELQKRKGRGTKSQDLRKRTWRRSWERN